MSTELGAGIGTTIVGRYNEWKRVETDSAGNIYVLGEISPPGESNHLWTAKYDPDGNILWEDNYTGKADEACYTGNLAIMPDGGVVITGQSWDEPNNISIVTIRYAPDGAKLWQRLEKAGYAHASGDDVAIDADGNVYVTGYGYDYSYWEDTITLGYSPDGNLLWTQIYAGPEPDQSDYPQAIAVDDDANVFVAGHSWDPETSNNFTTIRYSPLITAVGPGEIPGVDARLVVHEPRPNPFNPATTIAFDLPVATTVSLRVYDVSGRLVRTLLRGEAMEQGRHDVVWNGRNDSGRDVTSGVYFCRIVAGEFTATRQMALVK